MVVIAFSLSKERKKKRAIKVIVSDVVGRVVGHNYTLMPLFRTNTIKNDQQIEGIDPTHSV